MCAAMDIDNQALDVLHVRVTISETVNEKKKYFHIKVSFQPEGKSNFLFFSWICQIPQKQLMTLFNPISFLQQERGEELPPSQTFPKISKTINCCFLFINFVFLTFNFHLFKIFRLLQRSGLWQNLFCGKHSNFWKNINCLKFYISLVLPCPNIWMQNFQFMAK